MRIKICLVLMPLLLLLVSAQLEPNLSETESKNGVELEFDQSDITNLNLKLKWKFKREAPSDVQPNRFIVLMQQKRLNFSTFVYDYPQLIDDGKLKRELFFI